MNKYKIYEDYRGDKVLRNKFNIFTKNVFSGLDFEEWHQRGLWLDKYIPFSIIKDNKIVSNASITKMKILINEEYVNGIQFGTVGTLSEYRNQGLSRYLMEYVIDKYKDSTDIFFLFANDSVLNFYPKFGFKKYDEFIYESVTDIPGSNYSARKLNINSKTDFLLIQNLLENRILLTKSFGASDYAFITFWHILYVFSDNLFYIEDENIIFIITENRDQIFIWDVIYTKPVEMISILPKVIKNDRIKSISYYFPPDRLNFKYDKIKIYNESPLFIRGDFKIIGKHFKFPITAQT